MKKDDLKLVRYHKCGSPLADKAIPIDEEIFGSSSMRTDFCPKCKTYSFSKSYSKKIESKDPADIVHFYRAEILEKKPRTYQREIF